MRYWSLVVSILKLKRSSYNSCFVICQKNQAKNEFSLNRVLFSFTINWRIKSAAAAVAAAADTDRSEAVF